MPAKYGPLGLAMAGLGVATVVATHFITVPGFSRALNPLVFGGALVYLLGAFYAVATTGYRAGSPTYLTLRVFRVVLAAAVIFAIFRDLQTPV